MNPILKTLLHTFIGGGVSYVLPHLINLIPLIPHIDPITAAVLGSAATSAASAVSHSTWFPKPPEQK